MKVEQELGPKLKYGIKKNEPMADHTSWLVGGPADYFLYPTDLNELLEIVTYSEKYQLPLFILGNGTNLLVLDGGIRGLVVNIGAPFSHIEQDCSRLKAGAGLSMAALAKSAASAGLSGLEFAIGIPGSLGGALVMNAGAFGGYIGEKVQSVKLVDFNSRVVNMSRAEISFGYRTSSLAGKGIITEVILELEEGSPDQIYNTMEHCSAERRRRHPVKPSAGSVFRNLPDQPAGRIIENAGAKGMRIGGAEVSEHHANFIINTGNATAADILNLIKAVQDKVKSKYGIELQPEIRIIGEE